MIYFSLLDCEKIGAGAKKMGAGGGGKERKEQTPQF